VGRRVFPVTSPSRSRTTTPGPDTHSRRRGRVGGSLANAGGTHRVEHPRDQDPQRPAARRRPFRLRPVEGPPRGAGRAGRPGLGAARHLAPPGPGEEPGQAGARGRHAAVLAARGLPGGARQRRVDRVLGHRRVRADPGEVAAPALRRVLQQVRRVRQGRALAGRPAGHQGRAGQPPAAGRGRRRGRLRADPQRDLDRRRDADPAPGRRERGRAGAGGRDLGRRRPAGGRARDGRLLLRPAEGLRLRRRPVDRRLLPPRWSGSPRSPAPAGTSRPSSTCRRRSTTRPRTRRTTPPRWPRCS
jgi:hypothetical protein